MASFEDASTLIAGMISFNGLIPIFGITGSDGSSETEIGIMTIPSYNNWLARLNDSSYKNTGPTGAWAGEWWSIYNYLQYGGICVVGSTGSLGNNNLVDLDIIFNDIRGVSRQPVHADAIHLEATINWLCRAQDQRMDQKDQGGISAGWSFEDGWLPSYPETSGYIIETLLAAEKILNNPELKVRAEKIVDWELSIQNADGSFPGHFGEVTSNFFSNILL